MAPDRILSALASIANEWKTLAMAWHVFLATLLLAVAAGWRPSARVLGGVLGLMVVSVSAVAWLSGNPFNGTALGVLAGGLTWMATRFTSAPLRFAKRPWTLVGAGLIAFGSTYPHFLATDIWTTFLYAAPFGLLPCPTLAVVIGITLLVEELHSAPWSTAVALAGVIYGGFGVFRLGVELDWVLLLASVLLAFMGRRRSSAYASANQPLNLPGIEDRKQAVWTP